MNLEPDLEVKGTGSAGMLLSKDCLPKRQSRANHPAVTILWQLKAVAAAWAWWVLWNRAGSSSSWQSLKMQGLSIARAGGRGLCFCLEAGRSFLRRGRAPGIPQAAKQAQHPHCVDISVAAETNHHKLSGSQNNSFILSQSWGSGKVRFPGLKSRCQQGWFPLDI